MSQNKSLTDKIAEARKAVADAVLRGNIGPEEWPVDICNEADDHWPIWVGDQWVVRVAPSRPYPCGVECCGFEYIGSRVVPANLIPNPEEEQ